MTADRPTPRRGGSLSGPGSRPFLLPLAWIGVGLLVGLGLGAAGVESGFVAGVVIGFAVILMIAADAWMVRARFSLIRAVAIALFVGMASGAGMVLGG